MSINNWLLLIWITAVGACVGSFLNVVVYRLPEGKSLSKPGSHCPKCGHMLRWWENVPVLAWFYLRGRCTQCKAAFSFQYPFVEMLTAGLFALLFLVYYQTGLRPTFAELGISTTWPLLTVHLILIAGLLAATLIDARLYIIPLQIPWLVTAVALAALPFAAWWQPDAAAVLPVVNVAGVYAAGGATIGLALALVLLYLGVLPRSFDEDEAAHETDVSMEVPPTKVKAESTEGDKGKADQAAPVNTTDVDAKAEVSAPAPLAEPGTSEADERHAQQQLAEAFLAYPHSRREVLKELLFVALPLAGALIALLLMPPLVEHDLTGGFSLPVRVLAGAACGYFVGGGLVWFTRILGTLAFGKEAMGLGDVHLLAAIGAVVGSLDSVLIFFIAPFFGLAFAAISLGVNTLVKREVRIIPYGPYLAAAALLVMLLREPLLEIIFARLVIL